MEYRQNPRPGQHNQLLQVLQCNRGDRAESAREPAFQQLHLSIYHKENPLQKLLLTGGNDGIFFCLMFF